MFRYIMALVVSLLLATACPACPCQGDGKACDCPHTADCDGTCNRLPMEGLAMFALGPAIYGMNYEQERVARLPRDHDRPYLTVIGNPKDARYQAVCEWFQTEPTLHALRAQTHYAELPTTNPMFRERYASTTVALPLVRLQAADGATVAEFSGRSIPISAEALAHGLNAKAAECFGNRDRDRGCPRRRHDGDKDVEPGPLVPPPVASRPRFPWVALVLLTVGAVAVALLQQWRQMQSAKK